MKTKFLYVMLATLMLAVSCSKDDSPQDDEKTGIDDSKILAREGDKIEIDYSKLSDEELLAHYKRSAVLSILRHLTDVKDTLPADFYKKAYEPVYGYPSDDGDQQTRSKLFENVEDAETDFLLLVGSAAESMLTTTSDGYSLVLKGVESPTGDKFDFGSLEFHRAGGELVGYVDVDIPCIPHLSRINYKSPSSIGDNAGNSPYLEGDIVYVPYSTGLCDGYYLCLSNSSGVYPGTLVSMCINEPKGHKTINFDGDNDGCWIPYNNEHGYKTSFNDICGYVRFIVNYQDKVNKIKQFFNGELTIEPSHGNCISDIFPQGFNNDNKKAFVSSDGRAAAIRYDADWGDYVWYYAYYERISRYAKVHNLCGSAGSVERRSFTYVLDPTWDSHYSEMWNYTMNVINFYDEIPGARMEFRSMSKDIVTKEEAAKAEAERQRIAEEEEAERQRIEAERQQAINAASIAAEDVTTEHLGWCYASNNRLFEFPDDALKFELKPLGILVYVNDGSANGKKATEYASGYGHGLVMSYRETFLGNFGSVNTIYNDYPNSVSNNNTYKEVLDDYDGLEKTKLLVSNGVLKDVVSMKPTPPEDKTSGWFIPSIAQWLAILCKPGLGDATMPSRNTSLKDQLSGVPFDNINMYIGLYDAAQPVDDGYRYWTSTAYRKKRGFNLMVSNNTCYIEDRDPQASCNFRPVFAF